MACDLGQAVDLRMLTVVATPQRLGKRNQALCEDALAEYGRTAAAATRKVELGGPFAMELYVLFQDLVTSPEKGLLALPTVRPHSSQLSQKASTSPVAVDLVGCNELKMQMDKVPVRGVNLPVIARTS